MLDSIVLHRSFFSHTLSREKRYCIYLPPGYDQRPASRYSTLYLLPGLMDYERTWFDKGHAHETADQLLIERRIGPMILVTPDKDATATDEEGGEAFAHYLGHEVITHIDHHFRTISHRSHRGIEGLSLGAAWTWRMMLRQPELFSSYGMLSGGLAESIPEDFGKVRDYLRGEGARFRLGVGAQEPEYYESNRMMVDFLKSQGFYCEFDVQDGPHDWPLWRIQVRNSLQFHYYSFNPHS